MTIKVGAADARMTEHFPQVEIGDAGSRVGDFLQHSVCKRRPIIRDALAPLAAGPSNTDCPDLTVAVVGAEYGDLPDQDDGDAGADDGVA